MSQALRTNDGRIAGFSLLVSSALAVLFLSLHPVADGHGAASTLESIVRQRGVSQIVHGAMITIIGVFLFGQVSFALRQGVSRAPVLAGLIAYAIGCAATIAAPIISGFILSDLAERFVRAPAEELRLAVPVFTFCSVATQLLTKFGLVAISTGILLWSFTLLRQRGLARLAGAAGLAAGFVPIAILLFAGLTLRPMNLTLLMLVQSLWNVAVAVLLLRRA
jgi:hypothetical protein